MKSYILVFFMIFISIIFISCEEADLSDGDYCTSIDVETVCQNDKLFVCEDGEYNSTSCETVCNKQGLNSSGECKHDSEIDRDLCWCETSNEVCIENTISCDGDDSLYICINDGWEKFNCDDELCQSGGYSRSAGYCSYSSETGNDVCWCYE